MAWTTPHTWSFEEVPSYSQFNTFIKSNQDYLKGLFDIATGHDHAGGTDDGTPVAPGGLAASAVSASNIAGSAVTTATIDGGAVGTAGIAASAITAAKIAGSAITAAEIDGLTITAAEIAANAITTAKIAGSAVTTATIDGGAVTNAEIGDDAIDDRTAGSRIIQLYRRQGGNITRWSSAGSTNYTPGAVRMQCGMTAWGGSAPSGSVQVTFPVAFSDEPLVFIMPHLNSSCPAIHVNLFSETSSVFTLRWWDHDGIDHQALNFPWLAIGPE